MEKTFTGGAVYDSKVWGKFFGTGTALDLKCHGHNTLITIYDKYTIQYKIRLIKMGSKEILS